MPTKKEDTTNDSKVLKKAELSGNNAFFSWLWFAKQAESTPEKKEVVVSPEEKKEVVVDAEKQSNRDEFLTHATTIAAQKKSGGVNAKVLERTPHTTNKPVSRPFQKPRYGGAKPTFRKGEQRKPYMGKNPHGTPAKPQEATAQPTKPVTPKKPKIAQTSSTLTKKWEITIGDIISVKEFSEKMGIPLQDVMKLMLHNKVMGGINTALDFDTASLLAEECNVKVIKEQQEVKIEAILEGNLQAILDADKESSTLQERAPIVTVMGHVDHGKTSLLDYLRKTNVAGGEAGGITQSIGASMVTHNGKEIAFIDTPWHELFTSLRARGAKITNIAIIVIAADDWIKPQTIESISHAKEAGVPIIIAVTKIDKPNNNFEKIKTDVAQHGITPEERGGDTPMIGVSSITGQGIDDLLDHILLQTEILELKYNPNRSAVWVVVDAYKDAKQWISTSLLILTWTLQVGDVIVVHNTYGKVKRMLNRKGKPIKKVSGGEPVMILWLSDIPEPGRIMEWVDNEKEAQKKVSLIQESVQAEKASTNALQWFMQQMSQGDKATLKVILRADGPSSLEALQQAIDHISLPDGVDIKKVHADIGAFTDSDLSLAQASDAVMIGFNSKVPADIRKRSDHLKVVIKNYDIIYELVEYIENVLNGMIEVELQEVVIGKLDVLWVFYKKEKMMVIGWKVSEWKILNGAKFRLYRDNEEISKGEITSLQREQNNVKEAAEWHECGMKVTVGKRIVEGDMLEFFVME